MSRWNARMFVIGFVLAGTAVSSQDQKPAPKTEDVPVVSEQDKRVLQQLQVVGDGFSMSIGVLQEKLDSVNAEKMRQITRITAAHPGYELTPQLTFVKKK